MRKRKTRRNFNFILIILAVAVLGWIAADFYANIYRHPQEKDEVEIVEVETKQNEAQGQTQEDAPPEAESGLAPAFYRDDRYGIEFQYPFAANDARCPKLEKTDDGFSLGDLYFFAGASSEAPDDFMARQLQGMEIENQENIAVAGRDAVKIDYQTPKAGLYGSSVFVQNAGRAFEFGLLAGETFKNCGSVDDYGDRLYRSVITTLKFDD
jgi:hypothetical protein